MPGPAAAAGASGDGLQRIWIGLSLLCTAMFASLFGHLGGKWLDRHGPRGVVL